MTSHVTPRLTREVRLRLSLLFVFLLVAPAYADDVQIIAPGVADELLGHTVRVLSEGKPPDNIGRVIDVLVDTDGHPVAAVLDFGGFLGVGNRKIAVTWSSLQFAPAKDGLTITPTTKARPSRFRPSVPEPRHDQAAISPRPARPGLAQFLCGHPADRVRPVHRRLPHRQ
jgi:hypothetical protein